MKETGTIVELEAAGPIGTLWLNRPDALNALSDEMRITIRESIERLDADPQRRIILIRGRGRAFCSGADRNAFAAIGDANEDMVRESLDLGTEMMRAIISTRSVVVSAIHGHCIGGGVSIALASDLAIGTTDSKYLMPEVDLGLPFLWGSTPLLIAGAGFQQANRLSMICERFDAQIALDIGLIAEICEPDELERRVLQLADDLAKKPAGGLLSQKQLVREIKLRMLDSMGDENALGVDALVDAYPHLRKS